MALGARRSDVLRLVLKNGLMLILPGTGFGLLGTLGVSSLISSLLFGTSAADSLTLVRRVGFPATAVALIACYVPARRAAKVDPIEALQVQLTVGIGLAQACNLLGSEPPPLWLRR